MSVSALGYVGLRTADPKAFRTYAEDVIGLAAVEGPVPGDADYFKLDERQWRLRVASSDTPGVDFIGWEVPTPPTFELMVERLEAAGVSVEVADAEGAVMRGVLRLARFIDPAGFQSELFCGPKTDPGPFVSPTGVSGFKTDELGLGHVFLMVPDVALVERFYTDVLGLRLTDLIQMGGGKSARFYRCGGRHHSLALLDLVPTTKLGHLLLEMNSIDDVGKAYDRAQDKGCTIVNHFGRHSNDKMISFYMQSPADVDFEIGFGGLRIDDANWSVTEFQGTGDIWGHRGPMMDELIDARAND